MKLYVDVEGPFPVETTVVESRVDLGEPRTVRIGARSYHERPAATVTTTADPVDAMRAVSTFGSAVKTTGSERSYPTLRGHPSSLELGDELSVPGGLGPPESAVRLEVPRSLRDVLTVSPLAYYLGARGAGRSAATRRRRRTVRARRRGRPRADAEADLPAGLPRPDRRPAGDAAPRATGAGTVAGTRPR